MDNYKEYLEPKDGYALVKQNVNMPVNQNWIEIPEGAELYVYWRENDTYNFQVDKSYFEDGSWQPCAWTVEEIKSDKAGAKILWSRKPKQDPDLISGADAHKALLAGENVQYSGYGEQDWDTALNCNIGVFLNHEKFPDFKFRIVPRTIKLELEIPAPYKAKIGGRDDTSFVLNVGRHEYCYKTEEDYTKARDALEAVFDSALRGTNS